MKHEEREILVKVEGVSKKFSKNLKKSLRYGLADVAYSIFGIAGKKKLLRESEFWAVKDISFELARGECIGLIGHNGAGKSTLLKMLNGLIKPDSGQILMRGKVGALIELGAGFNPILTGRENVYINGQILGFSKKQIDEIIDTIIDFAEINEFIDSPVQNYSSGMKVRLGFAIAAQMKPDVLIIDEVLAVGDLGFILKCFNTIDNLLPHTAVIFVSHSMPMVSRICTQIILLDNAGCLYKGDDVAQGIDLYYSKFSSQKSVVFESEFAKFISANVISKGNKSVINWLDDLTFSFSFRINRELHEAVVYFTIFDKEQKPIGICFDEKIINQSIAKGQNEIMVDCLIKVTLHKIQFSKGIYGVTFGINKKRNSEPILRIRDVLNFQVISEREVWPPLELKGEWH